jgi:hypothetical protein
MSKASKILENLAKYKLIHEYDVSQTYHVVHFSDHGKSGVQPVKSGSYEDCIGHLNDAKDPDLVVVDDAGCMKTNPGNLFGQGTTTQPKTAEIIDTAVV